MIAQLKSLKAVGVEGGAVEGGAVNVCPNDDLENFSITLRAVIGLVDEDFGESFYFQLCTPRNILDRLKVEEVVVARNLLIVNTFDYGKVFTFVERLIRRCPGSSWVEIAKKIGRFAQWEFEDRE